MFQDVCLPVQTSQLSPAMVAVATLVPNGDTPPRLAGVVRAALRGRGVPLVGLDGVLAAVHADRPLPGAGGGRRVRGRDRYQHGGRGDQDRGSEPSKRVSGHGRLPFLRDATEWV